MFILLFLIYGDSEIYNLIEHLIDECGGDDIALVCSSFFRDIKQIIYYIKGELRSQNNFKMDTTMCNEAKWIEPYQKLNTDSPYLKAIPLRPIGDNKMQYEVIVKDVKIKIQVSNDRIYLMSNGNIYDDMCDMDVLNQPEVLNNLVCRYRNDQIFTFIGPILVVINPYRIIHEYFNNEEMLRIKNKILEGHTQTEKPHIYLIAGGAYTSMIEQQKKQAIVISGESGAGKTQSTKYCMQFLTSLSHNETLSIQTKILACNPILEAFGNSKTTRNDNSSRFGKYVQIYFAKNNTIVGANINSYLLEKSRVVATAEKQRNFHIFYTIIASQILPLKQPQQYKYLQKSKCYDAKGINDKEFFNQIRTSMNNIGFTEKQQMKIWELLSSILQLGNVEFNDADNKENEAKPCLITEKSRESLLKLSTILNIKQAELQKILLFEKKVILNQLTFKPYNKDKCIANANTLSKAIYNSIFEFILIKIQKSLKPDEKLYGNKLNFLSINILDIFGFENFDVNSFEQFCINFTNQKLLKLYNQYVFQREMKILREDGLDQEVLSIKPPTNDNIIEIMSGKMSLFSIINDFTMPIQFKDSDIMSGFQSKLKSQCLQFDKLCKNKFVIIHSQCSVKYEIDGFKQKNQDKVLPDIAEIVNSLFKSSSKGQQGKTILTKFSKEIDDLMQELTSSNVHFIRCIKPNEKKIPKSPQERYIQTQVRYLGVFETIQIRKKTFSSRWLYEEFLMRFQTLFEQSIGDTRVKTVSILNKLTKSSRDYLLGNKRVYINTEIQTKLQKKFHQIMKRRMECGKTIWKIYKKCMFKHQVRKNLKKLVKRIKILKKVVVKFDNQIKLKAFTEVKIHVRLKIEKEKAEKERKAQEELLAKKKQEMKLKQQQLLKKASKLTKVIDMLLGKIEKINKIFIENCKNIKGQKNGKKALISMKDAKIEKSCQNLNKIVDNQQNSDTQYKRTTFTKQQSAKAQYNLNQSFLNDTTILMDKSSSIAFEGTLQVPFFNRNEAPGLKKLKLILADKFHPKINESEDDLLSPPSEDAKFQIEETPNQIMKKISEFNSKEFFKKVLRKRTNFFGMQKDEDDILVVKHKPLSKSLTKLEDEDQKDAIKIFKEILKVSDEPKLDLVFSQVQRILFLCRKITPQLVNEILLQLVKQSNNASQLNSIRVIQTLVVFLHVFEPDPDFLFASLNFYFKKLSEVNFSDRHTEYFRYVYRKIMRKLMNRSEISFMPVKYQIVALMCKRIISVPIHLVIGGYSHVKVESYENLEDIKVRSLQELGINTKRLIPELFGFFQLTNFKSGTMQERPLNEKLNVWDLISYWQRSVQKFIEQNEPQPTFYLILKIRFAFECDQSDEEAIQLQFGQTYYDYLMGKIKLSLKEMALLAACIKKIQFSQEEPQQIRNCYPMSMITTMSTKQLTKEMCQAVLQLSPIVEERSNGNPQMFMKFMFLRVAQESPLSLAFSISTDQHIKLHFRYKMMYLTDDNVVVQSIPIKSIIKYAQKENQFVFSVRGDPKTKVILTEHASICVKYMVQLQQLVTNKMSKSKNNMNKKKTDIKILENI